MPFIELVAQRRALTPPPGMQPPENAKDWFRIENSVDEEDSTDIYVYESIGGWFGMWADDFIRELKQVSTSKINLRLNSPGGSVFDGIAIANAIRSHPANVTVYVDSLAASIASVIALAGNRIVMMPQSQFMVHNASGGCYGDASEMTKMADLLDKQSRNIAEAYAQHTGRPLAEWQDYMAEETWFTAEEAVAIGLADEAMPMKPKKEEECAASASPQSLMNRAWDLSMYRYAGRENAPSPIAKQPVEITVELGGEDITQHVIDPLRGAVTAELHSTEWKFADSGAAFLEMLRDTVREAVRAELVVVEGTAVGSHSTDVKDGTWDAGSQEGHLPSPVPVATVRKMYTYYDEDKVEDGGVPKSACKLPHHFVSADGTPGAASINGVRNALARLPQTQGLSDAERKTAEAHLRAHLNAYSGGDEEDHVHEEIDDAEKKLPPFLQPDEDEEEEGDEECSEDAVEEEPEASASSTHNETDDWADLVGCLTTASPSADDVFNMLKEAW